MAQIWDQIFDTWGIKTVTKTDKDKAAYVPNRRQKEALHAEGHLTDRSTITLVLLNEADQFIEASFYESAREGAGRAPEQRMGKDFISKWLNINDKVVIGVPLIPVHFATVAAPSIHAGSRPMSYKIPF